MIGDNTKSVYILDTPRKDLQSLCEAFVQVCGTSGIIKTISSAGELLALLGKGARCDLIVVDYHLGDGRIDGLSALFEIRQIDPIVPVVMVAEKGDVNIANNAVRAGASDFLVRTDNLSERVSTQLGKIKALISLIEKNRELGRENELLQEAARSRYEIVGRSDAIMEVVSRVDKVASIPRPVLITGERGTGKELVARAIYMAAKNSSSQSGRSPRPMGSFVVVNCAAFTDSLLESELFGYEKGAFTGAAKRSGGRFEQADGGMLFMDEIGNMSLPFQRKILRVVEYGTFNRVGGREEIKVNARIVAATNADLDKLIREGKFLADLYDRLSFEEIRVPPLREREGDVDLLADYFLDRFMDEVPAFQGKRLGEEAVRALRNYAFPGNVRELKNVIERAVYRDTTDEITASDLGLHAAERAFPASGSFRERVEAHERSLVLSALEEAGGNQAAAARRLGLTYHQFRYYLKKYSA